MTVPGISGNVDGNVSYIDFKTPSKPATLVIPSPDVNKYSIIELAFRTMNGEYSSGDTRKALLGNKYQKVQDCVNILAADAGMFLVAKKTERKGILEMSVLSRDEFFKAISSKITGTEEDDLKIIEDLTDTYNSLEKQSHGVMV